MARTVYILLGAQYRIPQSCTNITGWHRAVSVFGISFPFPTYTHTWIKVKLSLCLINSALCHEDICGTGGIAPPFLTSALDGGEWSASRTCHFTPGEKAPGTHWIGGHVGPRAGLDAVEKRKILHFWKSNLGCSACSPSLFWLSYPDSSHMNEVLFIVEFL
jgi:hypothetical protein